MRVENSKCSRMFCDQWGMTSTDVEVQCLALVFILGIGPWFQLLHTVSVNIMHHYL